VENLVLTLLLRSLVTSQKNGRIKRRGFFCFGIPLLVVVDRARRNLEAGIENAGVETGYTRLIAVTPEISPAMISTKGSGSALWQMLSPIMDERFPDESAASRRAHGWVLRLL